MKGGNQMLDVLFQSLQTPNLQFKELTMEDSEAIHEYASNPDVSRFIGWPLMNSLKETEQFVAEMMEKEKNGTHVYANVIEKSTEKIIGTVMLFNFDKVANKAEIGYVFHQDSWGKGYGREAVKAVSDYGLKVIGLHKVHAQVTDANVGSSKILEHNGFIKEGRLKDHYYVENAYYDCLLYGKL